MQITYLRYDAESSGDFYRSLKQTTKQHGVIPQKTMFTIKSAVNTSNHRVNYNNSLKYRGSAPALLFVPQAASF
jgi:hypothetical protein